MVTGEGLATDDDAGSGRNQRLEVAPCNYWPLYWMLIDAS